MKKPNRTRIICIIGIVLILLSVVWYVNGGSKIIEERNMQTFDQILDNM